MRTLQQQLGEGGVRGGLSGLAVPPVLTTACQLPPVPCDIVPREAGQGQVCHLPYWPPSLATSLGLPAGLQVFCSPAGSPAPEPCTRLGPSPPLSLPLAPTNSGGRPGRGLGG